MRKWQSTLVVASLFLWACGGNGDVEPKEDVGQADVGDTGLSPEVSSDVEPPTDPAPTDVPVVVDVPTTDPGPTDSGPPADTGPPPQSCSEVADCDDGLYCTWDSCEADFCVHKYLTPNPNPCAEPALLCSVSGTAGERVLCPLKIIRLATDTPATTALEFVLVHDEVAIDEIKLSCLKTVQIPGVPPSEAPEVDVCGEDQETLSGHTIKIVPRAGVGHVVMLFNASYPDTPLANGHLSIEKVQVGESEFASVAVQLAKDVSADEPVEVKIFRPVASSAGAQRLDVQVSARIFFVGQLSGGE